MRFKALEDQAEILSMAKSKDLEERKKAAKKLNDIFADLPDKKQAWDDLIHLMHNSKPIYQDYRDERIVKVPESLQGEIGDKLGAAYLHMSDKKQAWADLICLVGDLSEGVQFGAHHALRIAISHVPDKKQAWSDLIHIAFVREWTNKWILIDILNRGFSLVSDIHDEVSANYALGRLCIYKATEAENEEEFKKELENAIKFFKNVKMEDSYTRYSADFCLPFYRSFYTLTFKKEEAEAEVQKYISEAKSAIKGSESKEKLLEAVENLGIALKEVQKAQDFNDMKSDLNAYRRYCDRACELLDTTDEKAPGASRLIRKGLPIIGEKIKGIIAEIQEKAKALCKETKGTQLNDIGKEIFWQGQKLSQIGNPIILDKNISELKGTISLLCGKLIEDDILEVLELINKITNEPLIENKVEMMNNLMRTILEKVKNMPKIEVNNSNNVQVAVGTNVKQNQNSNPPQKKVPKKSKSPKKPMKNEPPAPKEPTKPSIPYLSELESEIADIFKSIYQKDLQPGKSEVNAKTLESLKHKLHDLKASGNDIYWLDMGCGNGRCLDVLDDIQDRGNIYYHGIDISHKFLDDAQMRAKKYGINSKVETMTTAAMKFDSEFDLVSAVLFLHEVDPICLPYIIRNILRALKIDGTLVISDFEGPYEQEEAVVSWGAEYLKKFLSNIGGARMSVRFMPSGEFPKELGFYSCYVKKPELDEKRFEKFIEGYSGFMKEIKDDSRKMREELRSQINKKVCEILKRPDIDTKNITDKEKALLRESMGKEYGIKAQKIRLLTNEILFLDEKIGKFERGERCGSP